jgi:hypothetical protein
MAAKSVEIHLAEHYGARSGEQARRFLQDALVDAAATRSAIEATYAETGDVARTTAIVTDHIMTTAPQDFLPREVVSIVAGQMVRYIAQTLATSQR